jgi:hypothetical protein
MNNGFEIIPEKTNPHMYWSEGKYLEGFEMRRNVENNLRTIESF